MNSSVPRVLRVLWVVGVVAGLLAGCSGSSKSKRLELSKQDLAVHQHVLVVGAGPATVKLEVGMAGKLLMKGLNRLLESDKDSSFAESLREAGLLPRETAVETGVGALQELGWKATLSGLSLDSPGKKFKEVMLPEGACEEATSVGADSTLILYERFIIDVGATKAIARSDLWAHLFECPGKKLLWLGRDKRKLSLNRFILHGAKQVITEKKKTLADFLGSLRKLVEESCRQLVTSGLSR